MTAESPDNTSSLSSAARIEDLEALAEEIKRTTRFLDPKGESSLPLHCLLEVVLRQIISGGNALAVRLSNSSATGEGVRADQDAWKKIADQFGEK